MQQFRHNKVLWSEGLLLGPHHFQQMDRYHERRLQALVQPLVPYAWGTLRIAIDQMDLEEQNGFALQEFRGVLPGGTRVDVPEVDPAPPRREVGPEFFPPGADVVDVYLAVPVERPAARNYALPGGDHASPDSRYICQQIKVVDEADGGNEDEIVTAALNLRILFGTESSDNLEKIKIAEVYRDQRGRLSLRDEFVPPVLAIGASSVLMQLLRDVQGRVAAKCASLSATQSKLLSGRYDYSSSDPEVLWTLGQLYLFLPLLRHHCQMPDTHPEVVYRTLLQCAGQLCVLSANDPPSTLPDYSHEAPLEGFQVLRQKIEKLLELSPGGMAGQFQVFALQEGRSARGYRVFQTAGRLNEQLFTQAHKLYVMVKAVAAAGEEHTDRQMDSLPHVVTAASVQDIDSFVERAFGLVMHRQTTPPLGAPSTPETTYFEVEPSGPAFDAVRARRTLAVYVPQRFFSEFRSFELELVVD